MKNQINMFEPWNLKTEDIRIEDSLPTFIIFCEDEVSEPFYFKYFETPKIKINTIEKQKNMFDNVINAICHCQDRGVMGIKDGELCILADEVHVWCVFDRDIEETDIKEKKGNISFNESIKTAESKGMKVAFSNDAFELWILLHFEEIDPSDDKYTRRETYYEKLTEIFKTHPNPNIDLIKALAHNSFNYKQDLKHKNNFINIVRKEIVGNTRIAIERAKNLVEFHNIEGKQNHEKSPCTLVYLLVEDLIRLGEKEL